MTRPNALETQSPSPDTVPTDALLQRLRTLETELERAKALYVERDALTLELATRLGTGEFPDALPDGTALVIKDNFAASNVSWTAAPVRRFVAELTDTVTLAKRRARREKATERLAAGGES